jgi:hypothetical protein
MLLTKKSLATPEKMTKINKSNEDLFESTHKNKLRNFSTALTIPEMILLTTSMTFLPSKTFPKNPFTSSVTLNLLS